MKTQHLPATVDEMKILGWEQPDVIIVTGDAHVDHPAFPAALIGRVLEAEGFKVAVIARPDVRDPASITILGPPRLFWGVTAGALDSLVANYTALKKPRSDDAYAPGGQGGGRPDRAVTAYCNLIRKTYGKAAFIVAGGLEASLRRFAHYDFLTDSVRRPLLMDCGANVLVHGMGEGPVVEIARRMAQKVSSVECQGARGERRMPNGTELVDLLKDLPGVVYRVAKSQPEPAGGTGLPTAEEVAALRPGSGQADPVAHAKAYHIHEMNRDRLQWQDCGGMRVIANPPWVPSPKDLDRIFALPFTREAHPMYRGARIPALESVRFSVTSHRGCFGGCAFCAIGAHQGKAIVSRSRESILEEVKRIAELPGFRGTISDLGGPTANMYGLHCTLPRPCNRPSCLWPEICKDLHVDQQPYLDLLEEASRTPGVKHLFVSTGVRMDLALLLEPLIRALAFEHTSGSLKVAPEHTTPHVLNLMRKPVGGHFQAFLDKHRALSKQVGKEQFVLPYFIAAHPGCTVADMIEVMEFLKRHHIVVEQCQIFTPTPGTASTVMYATGLDPATLQPVYVEKREYRKQMQKALILYHLPESQRYIREALAERAGAPPRAPMKRRKPAYRGKKR